MDLREYYKNLREIQATLPSPHVVVVSLKTADGGKPDVITEVPTAVAARLIVERAARAATKEECFRFWEQNRKAKELADEQALANRVEVFVSRNKTLHPAGTGSKG